MPSNKGSIPKWILAMLGCSISLFGIFISNNFLIKSFKTAKGAQNCIFVYIRYSKRQILIWIQTKDSYVCTLPQGTVFQWREMILKQYDSSTTAFSPQNQDTLLLNSISISAINCASVSCTLVTCEDSAIQTECTTITRLKFGLQKIHGINRTNIYTLICR